MIRLTFNIVSQRIREIIGGSSIFWYGLYYLSIAYKNIAPQRATNFLYKIHRATTSRKIRRRIENSIDYCYQSRRISTIRPEIAAHKLLGTRILVIKPYCSIEEKGVLHIKFTDTINIMPRFFNMQRLLERYYLVIEPSWTGLCDHAILQYCLYEQPVFVLAPEEYDYQFIQHAPNLVPVRLGPSDWVDPRIAENYLGIPKEHDILMNSNWAFWKRHYVLFKALNKLPPEIKVALIGVPWGGNTVDTIRCMAALYKVKQSIDYFESIPYDQVIKINCASKLSLLLSLKEGSNRALAESMFCNVPVIALKRHVGGIRKNINRFTGVFADERKLHKHILEMLSNYQTFNPRSWANENISCIQSTIHLNHILQSTIAAFDPQSQWTTDIAIRSNSPESNYFDPIASNACRDENKQLSSYLNTSI